MSIKVVGLLFAVIVLACSRRWNERVAKSPDGRYEVVAWSTPGPAAGIDIAHVQIKVSNSIFPATDLLECYDGIVSSVVWTNPQELTVSGRCSSRGISVEIPEYRGIRVKYRLEAHGGAGP